MKQRRVGTLTMGVVLVLLGGMMILSQVNGGIATFLILNGWPLVLILLGGEVLWFAYNQKGEQTKLLYDVFSIFIIGIICLTSIGLYGLKEMGIISRVNAMVVNQSFLLNTEEEKYTVDESIKKIIVESPKTPRCDLKVRTGSENAVVTYGKVNIDAESRKKAEEVLEAQYVSFRKHGDVLYVSFDIPISGNMRMDEYNLILPENVAVEIDNTSDIKLRNVRIGANWQINNLNRVEVLLDENPNVKIIATVREAEDLAGNVNWQIKNEGSAGKNTDGDLHRIDYVTKGEVTCGDGKYKLNIISKNRVTINQI